MSASCVSMFQHYLYEVIINVLVHNNCFYQLHQFLQYHVLSDSKPLVRTMCYQTPNLSYVPCAIRLQTSRTYHVLSDSKPLVRTTFSQTPNLSYVPHALRLQTSSMYHVLSDSKPLVCTTCSQTPNLSYVPRALRLQTSRTFHVLSDSKPLVRTTCSQAPNFLYVPRSLRLQTSRTYHVLSDSKPLVCTSCSQSPNISYVPHFQPVLGFHASTIRGRHITKACPSLSVHSSAHTSVTCVVRESISRSASQHVIMCTWVLHVRLAFILYQQSFCPLFMEKAVLDLCCT